MKIKLRLTEEDTLEVKAHRILKDKFPYIKLYVHYAVKKGNTNYTKGFWGISTEDGFAIASHGYRNLRATVDLVTDMLEIKGKYVVLGKLEENRRRYGNVS
jgi:hypothetical protein